MDESTDIYTLRAVDAFCIIYRDWRNGHMDQWTGREALKSVDGMEWCSSFGM